MMLRLGAKGADEAVQATETLLLPAATKASDELVFPSTADEMTKMLGVDPSKVSKTPDGTDRIEWKPNENTKIRYESHPDGTLPYNPRHHDPHFHVEQRSPGTGWGSASKVQPEGYTLGSGTGFKPGEKLPGKTIRR